MDVVGSEIGQKMRSAIKAKLTELGCYVDDELPDYVMVMVANKRTRAQMEDDLQLFLGDNTELFVNWLHQVLKKLQEVTVAAPLKTDTKKDKSESKEKKAKDKTKKSDSKKSKKKDKAKEKARKKEDKKNHKSKKKSKHEMIRPNIPPLLMNIEKDSEPSITDVFAGQILKNHGVLLETYKDSTNDSKVELKEPKIPVVPIIDLETITQPEVTPEESIKTNDSSNITNEGMSEDQKSEITQIESKIQGLKKKLVEQLDSMSDDEDFLNIRTEAEELMNDFAEDVFQEISQPTPNTPPLRRKSPTPPKPELPKNPPPYQEPMEMETLPHIELNLPKRPIRERLGAREIPKPVETKEPEPKKPESPERFTPEKEPKMKLQTKSAKSRLGSHSEQKKITVSQDSLESSETTTKRLTSKVSVDSRARSCASVVRVRPRLRVPAPASSLLLRAVADAHKSLLNIPPKIDTESHKVKRALVLPMRRAVEAKKIVIQVPVDTQSDSQGDTISLGEDIDLEEKSSKASNDVHDKDTFKPHSITKVIKNTEYVPATSICDDDSLMDTINIHNPTLDKDKDTQFIVTMDGYHPNAFLAKKLLTEALLEEENKETNESPKEQTEKEVTDTNKPVLEKDGEVNHKKRLSNTSDESNTQVIIKREEQIQEEIKKCNEIIDKKQVEKRKNDSNKTESPPVKKRRASPIVFDVDKKKEKAPERERERTISASSDSHVTLSTTASAHKFDSIPPLSTAERKTVWCRTFPLCRYGSSCAFSHPRCKFAAACTRRGCVYSHAPNALSAPGTPSPILASHVVPAANYKTISSVTLPSMCKFYPNCVNPACHYYHPKPCRYGKACVNKIECNFYHNDVPSKFKYSV